MPNRTFFGCAEAKNRNFTALLVRAFRKCGYPEATVLDLNTITL